MATALICIVLAAIAVYAIFSYQRKVTRGCCGGETDAVQKIKPKDEDPAHYPYKYTLRISGMTCRACAQRIANAFNKEESFLATVNFKTGDAQVLAKSKTDKLELRKIVAMAGYTIEDVYPTLKP